MKVMHRVVDGLERALAVLLVIIAALGIIDLVAETYGAITGDGFLSPAEILRLLDAVLVVFIVVELFNIALAYMSGKNVIATVMEAGLVAVVRKLVVFETSGSPVYVLMKGGALAALILAVGATWFLLRRAGVCPDHPVSD